MVQDMQLHFISSSDDVHGFLTWLSTLSRDEPLSFDTETTGLSPYEPGAAVRLVQFGTPDVGWALDMDRWRGLIQDVFKFWNGEWVAHNAKFDINFLKVCEGINVKGTVHDTMLFSHLINPEQSHALKNLADKYVMPGSSAGQRVLQEAMNENNWTWASVPTDYQMYWAYAALDTTLTRRLFDTFCAMYPHLFASRSYELETAVMPIYAAMERRGVAVDMQYVNNKTIELSQHCAEVDAFILEQFGVKNRNSNQQVAKALIAEGVPLWETTATGLWKLDKEILKACNHPLADAVATARKATKVISTYFDNFDAVIHPDVRQCGARTGRTQVSKPAMQTLPRGALVRDAIIPREGKYLVSCDKDQVEMRVLAHFCKDPALMAAFLSGDLHLETARLVYNDPTIQKSDPRRQTAKNSGFAKVYGAGVEQFSRTAGIPIAEGARFLELYDQTFPGVDAFAKATERLVREQIEDDGRHYVEGPFGRRHYSVDRDYAVLNYLIQGTAAEVFKLDVISLDAAGFGDNLLLVVHDEVIMEVDDPDCLHDIERAMTFHEFDVELTASGDVYSRWGDKYR